MIGNRLLWSALPLIPGVALLGVGLSLDHPFDNVAWAAPAIAAAVTALVARNHVDTEAGRDGLAVLAAAAFLTASGVGLRALGQIGTWAWSTAHAAGPMASSAFLQSLMASWTTAWGDHLADMSVRATVAVLPVFAAAACAVPVARRRLTDSREVEGGPWSARWMTAAEAGYLARQKVGLPLGRLNGRLLRFRDDLSRGWRGGHHMLVSGTRGGKGVSGVLTAIIDHFGCLVVLDVKGELFAITRRWRQTLGRRVVVLNPLGRIEPSADCLNPLDYVRNDPDHITEDAEVIADGLVMPEGDAGTHFYIMGRNLIAATIEVVVKATEEEPERRNLNTVADILSSPHLEETLVMWRDAGEAVSLPAARAAASFLNAGDKERGSILTTVSKALKWTSSPPMRQFLQASNFDLNDLRVGKIDIFLVVSVEQLSALAVFLRLMVNILAGIAMRDAGQGKLPKLLLVLDEFVRLGRMQKLLDIATVAAGAGVECLFVTQDRAQISSVYRNGEADTLLASCATVRVFNLGRTDIATAQWIVSALGDRTVQTHSKPLDGKTKGSESEQRSKLLTPDQLLELPPSDMVALFSGRPPLRLKRIISHDDPDYRDKLDTNPTLSL